MIELHRMTRIIRATSRVIATLACLFAIQSAASASDLAIDTMLEGLDDPRGVAIRPGTDAARYDVFVADAGRIIAAPSDQQGTSTPAVNGFVAEAGPRGLLFLDRNQLVVTSAGRPAARLYDLSGELPVQAAATKQVVDDPTVEAVYAVARTHANDNVADLLIVAATKNKWPSGLGKIPIRAGTLDKLLPLGENPPSVGPTRCITVSKQGYVVACRTNPSGVGASTLSFHDPTSGAVTAEFPVQLRNVIALAYNSANDALYALGEESRTKQTALYRLDDASQPGKPGCKAVKITPLDNATALTFAPDDTLYISAAGDDKGKLLRLRGDL